MKNTNMNGVKLNGINARLPERVNEEPLWTHMGQLGIYESRRRGLMLGLSVLMNALGVAAFIGMVLGLLWLPLLLGQYGAPLAPTYGVEIDRSAP
jgi:hypothetical protein